MLSIILFTFFCFFFLKKQSGLNELVVLKYVNLSEKTNNFKFEFAYSTCLNIKGNFQM